MTTVFEQLKDRQDKGSEALRPQLDALRDLRSLLRFASLDGQMAAPDEGRAIEASANRELSHALALVEFAADVIARSDRHAREVEDKARGLVKLATEEMRCALDEAADMEKRLERAQAQLVETEQRLQEAINWNTRFYDAITAAFSAFEPPPASRA
jgi:hypothetical protein